MKHTVKLARMRAESLLEDSFLVQLHRDRARMTPEQEAAYLERGASFRGASLTTLLMQNGRK